MQKLSLMNASRIALLPAKAVLVNIARSSLVEDKALLTAIQASQVAAAGLDCFQDEPGANLAFAEHGNIVVIPHVGSATVRTRDAMGANALDNLDTFFRVGTPPDFV